MVKAECTWGEGPDIILSFMNHGVILFEDPVYTHFAHGIVGQASTDLTLEEAKSLLYSLQSAIMQVEDIEAAANAYFEGQGTPADGL
jgi:hypothetical protein